MTWELAQLNLAMLAAPLVSPQLADFVRSLDAINRVAEQSPGFRWRLIVDSRNGREVEAFQNRMAGGHGFGVIANLSTWADHESLSAYVFSEEHRKVVRRRREWFVTMAAAYEVCWWVPTGHRPDVREAEERLLHLRENGPSPYAFTFHKPFPSPAAAAPEVRIELGHHELLDRLEPLWLSLFDHHRQVATVELPVIDRADSWPLRRAYYQRILDGDPAAFVLLAVQDRPDGVTSQDVGYILALTHPGPDDTWPTGALIGEIETFAVRPDQRRRGIGTRLWQEAVDELAARGAVDLKVAALKGNERAIAFYRRQGLVPVATVLMRLADRGSTDTTE